MRVYVPSLVEGTCNVQFRCPLVCTRGYMCCDCAMQRQQTMVQQVCVCLWSAPRAEHSTTRSPNAS
eukprot:5224160-Lingulodinium_polyedra.AAC.1